MQQLGFKLLNDIPGSSPILRQFSCRYFTHATETIIWPPRTKVPPYLQLQAHEGSQSRQADEIRWEIRPPESWEKKFGKHPTQKPVALLERILLASTNEGDLVLDPFSGQRHHTPNRLPSPPPRSRLRTFSGLHQPVHPPHLFRNGTD